MSVCTSSSTFHNGDGKGGSPDSLSNLSTQGNPGSGGSKSPSLSPSPGPQYRRINGSLTLQQFVEQIEANAGGRRVSNMTTRFNRRVIQMPVTAAQQNRFRDINNIDRANDLVEDIVYNMGQPGQLRRSIHGLFEFNVLFDGGVIGEIIEYSW